MRLRVTQGCRPCTGAATDLGSRSGLCPARADQLPFRDENLLPLTLSTTGGGGGSVTSVCFPLAFWSRGFMALTLPMNRAHDTCAAPWTPSSGDIQGPGLLTAVARGSPCPGPRCARGLAGATQIDDSVARMRLCSLGLWAPRSPGPLGQTYQCSCPCPSPGRQHGLFNWWAC